MTTNITKEPMDHSTIPDILCPVCGYHMDCATGIRSTKANQTPKEGDVSICLSCGELLQFDASLRLEKAPSGVFSSLRPRDQQLVMDAQTYIKNRGLISPKGAAT